MRNSLVMLSLTKFYWNEPSYSQQNSEMKRAILQQNSDISRYLNLQVTAINTYG